jgi:hypothetical protein
MYNEVGSGTIITNSKNDSYYLCNNGRVIKVISITKTHLQYRKFLRLHNLYKHPVLSSDFDIYISSCMSTK